MDLRPYAQAELTADDLKDWDTAQYRALQTRDGLQLGLPKYHGALVLFYNKDLFRQYNVRYPEATWTHTDYQAAICLFRQVRDSAARSDSPANTIWDSMFDVSWDRIQAHVNSWGGYSSSFSTGPSKILLITSARFINSPVSFARTFR